MIHEDFTSEHEAYSTEPVALALAMEAGAQWETNAVSKNSDKVTPRANPKQQAAFGNLVSMIPDLASQISGSGHPDEKDAKAMTDAFKLIHSGGSPSENQTGIVIDFLNAKLTNSPYQAHEVYDWNEDLEGGPAVSKHLEIREKSSGKITFSTKWGEGWEQLEWHRQLRVQSRRKATRYRPERRRLYFPIRRKTLAGITIPSNKQRHSKSNTSRRHQQASCKVEFTIRAQTHYSRWGRPHSALHRAFRVDKEKICAGYQGITAWLGSRSIVCRKAFQRTITCSSLVV